MRENTHKVCIAVNVMRARLTVIGFNIAIVSFQISQLYRMSGGISVPGVDHQIHLRATIALFVALSLSLISMMAYIMSCSHDEVGVCDHWTFLAGDLLMYLAVAYTVTGFFAPMQESFNIVDKVLPDQLLYHFKVIQKALLFFGAFAWFLAIYCGPLISILRSPFSRQINRRLGTAYVGVVLVMHWVNTQAFVFEIASSDKRTMVPVHYFMELAQPLKW